MRILPRFKLKWDLLLAVYWAVVFASVMVALTSSLNTVYFLALLALGVPIYILVSRTIVRRYEDAGVAGTAPSAEIIAFPGKSVEGATEEAGPLASGKARPYSRKLG